MTIKPSLPKGMRDFLPTEVAKRQYIINIIKEVYERFGFQAIETPVMEHLSTLTGKYGEEGDKLMYKVLNSGDFLKKANEENLVEKNSRKVAGQVSEKGLRYDLTVPLARYVVQHQNELSFPFRRYHIAPVWRADRPQKGRYREFYQCDADVIGSASLLNEAELVQIMHEVFNQLRLNVTIRYNSRKLLLGIMEMIGLKKESTAAIAILDKLDKIGIEQVVEQLSGIGMKADKADVFKEIIETNNTQLIDSSELVNEGLSEVKALEKLSVENAKLDLSLARGLDYYTGCVFEVVCNDYLMGSIAGGGRYDNLTELFGKKDLTGVGISFGLDRIYDIMEGQEKFPSAVDSSCQVLFVHYDEATRDYAFKQLTEVRDAGINAEIYPDISKFQKQMKYANNKQIPYVCIVGDSEMAKNELTLKYMETGDQKSITLEAVIDVLKN